MTPSHVENRGNARLLEIQSEKNRRSLVLKKKELQRVGPVQDTPQNRGGVQAKTTTSMKMPSRTPVQNWEREGGIRRG